MADCKQEFEFVLTLEGDFDEFERLEGALVAAGCDDATLSLRFGRLYLAFWREAESYEEAVISALADCTKAGAVVHQVDDCHLVNQSEIARRVERTRSLINQYITGKRGPGGFPAPDCQITENAPLWLWCEVSQWLWENGLLNECDVRQARVVFTVNEALEKSRRDRKQFPKLSEFDEKLAKRVLAAVGTN